MRNEDLVPTRVRLDTLQVGEPKMWMIEYHVVVLADRCRIQVGCIDAMQNTHIFTCGKLCQRGRSGAVRLAELVGRE